PRAAGPRPRPARAMLRRSPRQPESSSEESAGWPRRCFAPPTGSPPPASHTPTTACAPSIIEAAGCQVSDGLVGSNGSVGSVGCLSLHAAEEVARLDRLEPQAAHLLLQELIGAGEQGMVAGVFLDHVAQVAEIMDQQLQRSLALGLALQGLQQVEDHIFD